MNDTKELNVGVIMGSTREGRFGEQPAQWIFDIASGTDGVKATLFDLRDYPLPFFNEPVSPAMIQVPYENEQVKAWTAAVAGQDAYIIATPEYNRGYPAVLKNALDYVYSDWNKKPVGFVSWGSVGGTRAVEQLRQVVVELQMVPIREGIHIARPWTMLDENGTLQLPEAFDESASTFMAQLLWWGKLLKSNRDE